MTCSKDELAEMVRRVLGNEEKQKGKRKP